MSITFNSLPASAIFVIGAVGIGFTEKRTRSTLGTVAMTMAARLGIRTTGLIEIDHWHFINVFSLWYIDFRLHWQYVFKFLLTENQLYCKAFTDMQTADKSETPVVLPLRPRRTIRGFPETLYQTWRINCPFRMGCGEWACLRWEYSGCYLFKFKQEIFIKTHNKKQLQHFDCLFFDNSRNWNETFLVV